MTTTVRRERLGIGRVLVLGLLLGAAAVFVTGLVGESSTDRFGWDFRYQYLPGAEAVADGTPLYLAPDDPGLGAALEEIRAYVYPPTVAVLLVPLTALSADAATLLALLGSVAALLGALALVGVRDLRCYAVVLVWTPAIGALTVINLTPLLVLALALLWRFRGTAWPTALVLGLAVPSKLLLAPMVVWAFAVRRAAAVAGAAVAVAVTAVSFAAIGFQGLADYPRLLRRLLELHAENSYSIAAMTTELGLPSATGRAVSLVVGIGLFAWCVALARGGDEERSFTCAVAAMFALSRIVWLHYLLFLLVPLAIARPRFTPLWLLPIVLWVSPDPGYTNGVATFVPAVVIVALLVVLLSRPHEPEVAVSGAAT